VIARLPGTRSASAANKPIVLLSGKQYLPDHGLASKSESPTTVYCSQDTGATDPR
jgi:hypothetical protein